MEMTPCTNVTSNHSEGYLAQDNFVSVSGNFVKVGDVVKTDIGTIEYIVSRVNERVITNATCESIIANISNYIVISRAPTQGIVACGSGSLKVVIASTAT